MSFSRRVREELQKKTGDKKHCRDALRYAAAVFGQKAAEDGEAAPQPPYADSGLLRRTCCRRAFLRGAFLECGSVSDPERSYHLEFVCTDRDRAEALTAVLARCGIEAGRTRRRKNEIVYVKDSSRISDLLGMMGASVSLLEFENARIVREVRGSVNRQVNCETANINKTAGAAARQVADILFIDRTVGLGVLPKGLDETARVRLEYQEATLQELGELMDPPVGKSGVNHRLRRISAIAEKLRSDKGGKPDDEGQCYDPSAQWT